MAQNYICDGCDKHEPVQPNGMWPKGWYIIHSTGNAKHACSPTCLITLAKVDELKAAEKLKAEAPAHV